MLNFKGLLNLKGKPKNKGITLIALVITIGNTTKNHIYIIAK